MQGHQLTANQNYSLEESESKSTSPSLECKQNSVMPAEKNLKLGKSINEMINIINLIESKIQLMRKADRYGWSFTKFEDIILERSLAAIRALLEKGADPNEIDETGNSFLHNAKSPQLITLLLEFHSDHMILNSQGLTPIQTAMASGLYTCAVEYGKDRLKQEELDNLLKHFCSCEADRASNSFIEKVLMMGANPSGACMDYIMSTAGDELHVSKRTFLFLSNGLNIKECNQETRNRLKNCLSGIRFDAAAGCLLIRKNSSIPDNIIDQIGCYLYHCSIFKPNTQNLSERIAKRIKSVSENKSKKNNNKCTLM